MALSLFEKFPIINYEGNLCVDLSKNIEVLPNITSNQVLLSPYIIKESIRSDQLSRQIYGNPYMEWLLWLTNNIINPYDWHMDQNQFYNYINLKYGDYILTQQKVAYYINNWYNMDTLTVSAFDALSPNLVKYWEPQYDAGLNVVSYNRRQVDWTVTTNHLVQYCFFNTTIPLFTNNEIVTVHYNSLISYIGQVCFSSNNQLNIQHVSGNYIPPDPDTYLIISEDNKSFIVSEDGNSQIFLNSSGIIPNQFSIIGSESNSVITITNINQISVNIYDTLSADEDVYYDPISIFDTENMENENHKYILYLSNNYTSQVISELNSIFQK